MHKSESDQEKAMHKILCGFGVKNNHVILARRPTPSDRIKKRELVE